MSDADRLMEKLTNPQPRPIVDRCPYCGDEEVHEHHECGGPVDEDDGLYEDVPLSDYKNGR